MPATIPADFGGDDVALSTTAALVYTASPRATASEPEVIVVQNNSAIDVTVGASDVADGSNGVLLPASQNASVSVPLRSPGTGVYAVSASGTPSVQVVRS